MNKTTVFLILGLLFVSALFFLAPVLAGPALQAVQGSVAVQVPDAINNAIGIGIAALVTAGLVYLQRKFGLDLQEYGTGIAGAIALWVVTELQNIINTIPEQYDPTINFVFYVLLYIFGTAGTLYLINKGKDQPGDPERLL